MIWNRCQRERLRVRPAVQTSLRKIRADTWSQSPCHSLDSSRAKRNFPASISRARGMKPSNQISHQPDRPRTRAGRLLCPRSHRVRRDPEPPWNTPTDTAQAAGCSEMGPGSRSDPVPDRSNPTLPWQPNYPPPNWTGPAKTHHHDETYTTPFDSSSQPTIACAPCAHGRKTEMYEKHPNHLRF